MQVEQAKVSTSGFYSLPYNGDLRYIRKLKENKYLQKLKLPVKDTISFLDELNFGADENTIKNVFGEPFHVYKNYLSGLPHTVYTYGLKSKSKKLTVEIHSLEDSFFLGTVFYQTDIVHHREINHQIREFFGLDSFHFVRDIIVDPFNNFIEFHQDPNHLVMIFSRLKWIESTNVVQNL